MELHRAFQCPKTLKEYYVNKWIKVVLLERHLSFKRRISFVVSGVKHPPLQIPWLIYWGKNGSTELFMFIISVVFLLDWYPNKVTLLFTFNIIFSPSWGGLLTSSCAIFFFFFCRGWDTEMAHLSALIWPRPFLEILCPGLSLQSERTG